MGEIFILWLAVTVGPGHIFHTPTDEQYATREACEADVAPMLEVLKASFPDDPNARVYCEPLTPQAPLSDAPPEKSYHFGGGADKKESI